MNRRNFLAKLVGVVAGAFGVAAVKAESAIRYEDFAGNPKVHSLDWVANFQDGKQCALMTVTYKDGRKELYDGYDIDGFVHWQPHTKVFITR